VGLGRSPNRAKCEPAPQAHRISDFHRADADCDWSRGVRGIWTLKNGPRRGADGGGCRRRAQQRQFLFSPVIDRLEQYLLYLFLSSFLTSLNRKLHGYVCAERLLSGLSIVKTPVSIPGRTQASSPSHGALSIPRRTHGRFKAI